MTSRRGFTLVEMMIALGVSAIILASLGIILKSSVEARITVESELRARRMGPAILEIIARDLRNAWGTGPDDVAEIEGSWFEAAHNGGDDDAQDELFFVTSVDSYLAYQKIRSDITEVGYYVKQNADDGPLAGLYTLYRREDFLVDKRPSEGGLGTKMSDRVVSFRVRYYDLPRDAVMEDGKIDPAALEEIVTVGSSTETDDWDAKEQERLPYAVRIELVLDATPPDSFMRKQKRRFAYYETLVRLPDFPKLDDQFKLFNIQAPAAPAPAQPGGSGTGGTGTGGTGTGGTGTGGTGN